MQDLWKSPGGGGGAGIVVEIKIRETRSVRQRSRRLVRPSGSRIGLKKSSVWDGATTHMNIGTQVFFNREKKYIRKT